MLKIGDSGKMVKILQNRLNKVLGIKLSVDGDYGNNTYKAVKKFQKRYKLVVDGIYGSKTHEALQEAYYEKVYTPHLGKKRFVVFVDAGHGGMDDDGNYVTPGKRAFHKGLELHQGGHYYEGVENRLIAEEFIDRCLDVGIMCVRTYHPYKDTSLRERAEIIRSYLRRGYYGYLYSIHSNAISTTKNSLEKLNNTRGFMVFSTVGVNFSDEIATQHFYNVQNAIGADNWTYRTQSSKDGDEDYEVNFQILRETDLKEFDFFGGILEEFGFHTSQLDAAFITNADIRNKRVKAAVKTAVWVKEQLQLKQALAA